MYTTSVPCTQCATSHEKIVSNKSSAVKAYISGKKKAFCSSKCRQEHFKQTCWITLECKQCKEPFEVPKSLARNFCSYKCYWADLKEYPKKYDLMEKARYASTFTNTSESINKMRKTKLDKGISIDWTDASWKQFWRRCNELTRKRRAELIGDWDGYDYIDGEYIKPYLELHYSHGKYPTLDHVIPRSTFFKEGKTPKEACDSVNLKWTKRSNNSRKYNK